MHLHMCRKVARGWRAHHGDMAAKLSPRFQLWCCNCVSLPPLFPQVNPKANFGDAIFVLAALVIATNIFCITVLKIRLF